jgi:site-specific DNA-methyltransferase (adenine-specific)
MAISRTTSEQRLAQAAAIIVVGSAEPKVAELPEGAVQTTVTSPPYYRQKDYHAARQIGWEPSVGAYVERLKRVLIQLHRVTAPSGSCFFVVGDTYLNKSLQLVPHPDPRV